MPDAAPEPTPLSQALLRLAESGTSERISLQDLLDGIKAQARPTLLILFAIPNTLPSLPGVSAILGLPLVYLTLQMMLGNPVHLPDFIGKRSLKRSDLQAILRRAEPWLVRIERILTPRLPWLSLPAVERVLGGLCLFLSLMILAPVPFGNNLPALAIILIALGFLERDGYFILSGLFTAVLAVALVLVIYGALIKAALLVWFGA